MKAIKVFVDKEESYKIPYLVGKLNGHEDIAMTGTGATEFVVAATGECAMAYAMAIVKGKFNDCSIEIIK